MNAKTTASRVNTPSPTGRLTPSQPQWQDFSSLTRSPRPAQAPRALVDADYSALERRVLALQAR